MDGRGLRAFYDHLQDFSWEGAKITSIIRRGKTDLFLCNKEPDLICRLSYEFNLKNCGNLYYTHPEPAKRLTLVRVLNPCNLVPRL